jgi:hypothetical protein
MGPTLRAERGLLSGWETRSDPFRFVSFDATGLMFTAGACQLLAVLAIPLPP